jgi:hypothetical protein
MADLGENSCVTLLTQDRENAEGATMETDSIVEPVEGQSSSQNIDRDFTTEIFKIEIGNLPKCYSVTVSYFSNLLPNF